MVTSSPIRRLGTRGSALARWQTQHVAHLLRARRPDLQLEIEVISTRGDRVLGTPLPLVGGKGLFTAELERALRRGAIDFAVHSLKDLPTEDAPGLTVGATPRRANVHDALVSRNGYTLDTLPKGAVIGTSSRRRAAQLLHLRPDLQIHDIRGNVETRVRKALDLNEPYTATVLAVAGLERLGLMDVITQVLPLDVMLPAPGQGALAVQCRDEPDSLHLLASIHDPTTGAAVRAERAFLAGLGGGCSVPVAALATIDGDTVHLRGRILSVDGGSRMDVRGSGPLNEAALLGQRLAQRALEQGAATILESVSIP